MADIAKKLGSNFKKPNRYPNFGACLNHIKISGFRGIECQIDFEFPVTAITGLNGAGKSTITQLLLCGYKKLSTATFKRYYIKDFFPVSVADPKPFGPDAFVEYKYQRSNDTDEQNLRIARANTEWSGYKRQPEKASIYIGLTFYLPKVERRDLTIYSAKDIELSDRAEVEDGGKWASRILGNKYDEVFFQGVRTPKRAAELGMASRLGAIYSENNMGFGEGRVIHTIRLLESCPIQSLVVLEEPETSLHEFAQHEFAKYLMNVSFRRGHQIFFSTHSSAMIKSIPTTGRKMLARDECGVTVHDRLSSIHLRNALSEGHNGHLIVCVEDAFAQSFLREIMKSKNRDLLRRVKVLPFGDAIAVKSAVKVLRKCGVRAVGVRDGDQKALPDEKLFTLPGSIPPEKLIFLSNAGKETLKHDYGFDIEQHLKAHPDFDHHGYAEEVAKQTSYSQEVIESDCFRSFMSLQEEGWGQEIVDQIDSEA